MYGMRQKTMKTQTESSQADENAEEPENPTMNNYRDKICQVLEFILEIQSELSFTHFLSDIKTLMLELERTNPGSISQLQIEADSAWAGNSEGVNSEKMREILQKIDDVVSRLEQKSNKIDLGNSQVLLGKLLFLLN